MVSPKQPLDVHLYVTPRCNLTCPHCYYDALDRTQHPDFVISAEKISDTIVDLCDRFDADISLEGGEPLLRMGFEDMLAKLPADILGSLTVTTNGTVPLHAPESVLGHLGSLRVSIDGHTDELQRELRGVELEPVLATCHGLQASHIPFAVRMTLWRRNIAQLEEIYAWADAHRIAWLSLFEFQPSGRGAGLDLRYGVTAPQAEGFLDDLVSLQRPDCLRRLTLNLAERRIEAVLSRRERLAKAGLSIRDLPPRPNCTVNYDGSVGISPWRVTAHGAPDVFTSLDAPDWLDVVRAAAADGGLDDGSGCISRVQVFAER
jgi:MoaA/NifB/PqqE/SkfB family radical SAM enzyme